MGKGASHWPWAAESGQHLLSQLGSAVPHVHAAPEPVPVDWDAQPRVQAPDVLSHVRDGGPRASMHPTQSQPVHHAQLDRRQAASYVVFNQRSTFIFSLSRCRQEYACRETRGRPRVHAFLCRGPPKVVPLRCPGVLLQTESIS